MDKALAILILGLPCLCLSSSAHKDGDLVIEKDDASMTSVRSRRSDDISSMVPVVSQHSQELAQVKAELSALKARTADLENVVCFTAHFSRADVSGLGLNQPVVFDNVPYNAGAGYDKNTGIFTAPVPGTYVLSLSLQRHGSEEDTIIMAIKKGGATLAVAEAGYSPFEHGTMVVTSHLNRGDVISVQPVHGSVVYGGMSTFFTVFRISPS